MKLVINNRDGDYLATSQRQIHMQEYILELNVNLVLLVNL
jgi:hypothetical protein